MSGGHWDYINFKIEDIAEELNPGRLDEEKEFGLLLKDVSQVLYDCEWWKSGDYSKEQFIGSWNKFKSKWLK